MTDAVHAGAAARVESELRLPADPQAVVLRWESLGGMSAAPPQTALLVHASGDFSARPPPGSPVRRTGRLDPAALQALLALVLVQHRFESINAEAIGEQMRQISQRTGRLFRVMDGGETHIEVQLPDHQHRVVFAALDAAHQRFPEIEPLRRLHAIKQQLLALADSAR